MSSFIIERRVESEALTKALDSVRCGLDEMALTFEPRVILFTERMSKRVLDNCGEQAVIDGLGALATHTSPDVPVRLGDLMPMGGIGTSNVYCLGFPISRSHRPSQRHPKAALLDERRTLAKLFGIKLQADEDNPKDIYTEALVLEKTSKRTRSRVLKAWQNMKPGEQEVTLLGSQLMLKQGKLVTVC